MPTEYASSEVQPFLIDDARLFCAPPETICRCFILLQCMHFVERMFRFVVLLQISIPTSSHAAQFAVKNNNVTNNKKSVKLNSRLLTRRDNFHAFYILYSPAVASTIVSSGVLELPHLQQREVFLSFACSEPTKHKSLSASRNSLSRSWLSSPFWLGLIIIN